MEKSPHLTIVADNSKPDKPKSSLRRAGKVAPYCPECKSSTWMMVNQGPADLIAGMKPRRVRCCVHCLAKGKVTVW